VKVTYAEEKPLLEYDESAPGDRAGKSFARELQYTVATPTRRWPTPPRSRVEQTYTTPVETHNPMELSATLASWEEDRLTVHDATQWVQGDAGVLA